MSLLGRKIPVQRLIRPERALLFPTSRGLTTRYKFSVPQSDIDVIKATLPLVAEAGTDFTKHFYARLFKGHPELLNLFNQTNQEHGTQPKRLLNVVATAAMAAIDTGELPGEAIEGICHKHCALGVPAEAYDVVGAELLGTIQDLLTDDKGVLASWGALYGDIAGCFVKREQELYDEMAHTPGGWLGRRQFVLVRKEPVSSVITRFKFEPVDGGEVPADWVAGKFTTVGWDWRKWGTDKRTTFLRKLSDRVCCCPQQSSSEIKI